MDPLYPAEPWGGTYSTEPLSWDDIVCLAENIERKIYAEECEYEGI